jgi:rod shape-determining protein MreC
MESFVVRYRNLLVLLALLVAQILGLAMQVHRTASGQVGSDPGDGRSVKLIRYWANSLVSPPEKALHSSGSGISGLWNNYVDLRHVRQQNADLQKTVDRLRLEQAALLEDAKQGQRLQALLHFQEKYIYKTVAAQTIGTSGTDQSRVFYIDKGKDDGIERDMAVITPDGIVGKIRDVFPHTAQVLAINDQSSGAGVILETTRIRGILRGNAAGQPQVEDVIRDQRIKAGEIVLTAGGDEIFPRGMPVGVVENVANDPERDGFVDVIVKPAAHLDQLDEVLVVTSTQPRFPPDQQQDMVASEALKSSETADQKASDGMAEKLPGLIVPNVPTEQQPLKDTSNPNPVSKPPMAIHPDRFTPGNAVTPKLPATPEGVPAVDGSGPPRKKPAPNAPDSNSNATPPTTPQGENR